MKFDHTKDTMDESLGLPKGHYAHIVDIVLSIYKKEDVDSMSQTIEETLKALAPYTEEDLLLVGIVIGKILAKDMVQDMIQEKMPDIIQMIAKKMNPDKDVEVIAIPSSLVDDAEKTKEKKVN